MSGAAAIDRGIKVFDAEAFRGKGRRHYQRCDAATRDWRNVIRRSTHASAEFKKSFSKYRERRYVKIYSVILK